MKDYTPVSPEYRETISIYETSDPAHADSVMNVPLKQIHDNVSILKKIIDEGGAGGSIATEEEIQKVIDTINEEGGGGGGADGRAATDEEIDEAIEELDDL